MEATKKVKICQYKAYREKCDDNWGEFIAIYDEDDNLVDRSTTGHPEGSLIHYWKGFEFIAPHGYSGDPRTECYVRLTNKVFLEKPDDNG